MNVPVSNTGDRVFYHGGILIKHGVRNQGVQVQKVEREGSSDVLSCVEALSVFEIPQKLVAFGQEGDGRVASWLGCKVASIFNRQNAVALLKFNSSGLEVN